MIEQLKKAIEKHGARAAIVPIQRLQNLRQDLEALSGREELNQFQQFILKDLFSLDLPEADFEIRSMIIAATPSPSSVNILFTRNGKRIPVRLPASYADKDSAPKRIEGCLNAFLNPSGYHARYAPQLPHKLLAVRSGLGMYGRNNICYVEGMGSFLNLSPFFSDLPCEEGSWQDIRQMELCKSCRACLRNCPTGAILPARFLINNERCLTFFNEAGGEWDFPEWINPTSHHSLYGCLRCQEACPVNEPYLKNTREPVVFNEEETAFLVEAKAFEQFPDLLKQKVVTLNMREYLGVIPRNLRVLNIL